MPSLPIGSFNYILSYTRDLAAAVKYTMITLQENYFVRYNWIWLIPVYHLLTGTDKLANRGTFVNNDKWWGLDQLTQIVMKQKNSVPDW